MSGAGGLRPAAHGSLVKARFQSRESGSVCAGGLRFVLRDDADQIRRTVAPVLNPAFALSVRLG
jgi:hypothetical protein